MAMRVFMAVLLAPTACTTSVAPQSADNAVAALSVPTDGGAREGGQCGERLGDVRCPELATLQGQPTWVGCSYTQWLSSRLSVTCDCVGTDGGAAWDCTGDKGRRWAHHIGPPPPWPPVVVPPTTPALDIERAPTAPSLPASQKAPVCTEGAIIRHGEDGCSCRHEPPPNGPLAWVCAD
jgi:hypothetical protein